MNLEEVISAVIEREAGYSNRAADKGGETMYGITVAVARAFGYMGEMRDMPRATAAQIYRERYWFQPSFDRVNALSTAIAEKLLDIGVNMGPGTAAKFLQRALNVLNNGGTYYPDVTPDGAIGKITLYAVRRLLETRGVHGSDNLLEMIRAQQRVRYMEIAESNPTQEENELGWQNRASA